MTTEKPKECPTCGAPVVDHGGTWWHVDEALSADAANLLDNLRGEVSRAQFVEALIRREAEGRKG